VLLAPPLGSPLAGWPLPPCPLRVAGSPLLNDDTTSVDIDVPRRCDCHSAHHAYLAYVRTTARRKHHHHEELLPSAIRLGRTVDIYTHAPAPSVALRSFLCAAATSNRCAQDSPAAFRRWRIPTSVVCCVNGRKLSIYLQRSQPRRSLRVVVRSRIPANWRYGGTGGPRTESEAETRRIMAGGGVVRGLFYLISRLFQ